MTWRDIAKKVIAKAIVEVGPDFDKISKNYYPFGDRKYHPYHIWLDEIARQRKEHQPRKDGQEELFPGGDSKYIIEALREQLETQAQVLAARDRIIERQERMIERACERLESGACLFEDEPCPKNYVEVGCRGCARRWLEEEAGK